MTQYEQDTTSSHSQSAGWFVATVYAVQFFFGGWFLFHGLNFFVEFFVQPAGSSSIASEVISALIHSGLFAVVKAIEVVVGIALLANRFVPLAVVSAFPVSFSIAYINLFANGDTMSIVVAITVIALNSVIALGHMDRFWPILAYNQGDPNIAGLVPYPGEAVPATRRPTSSLAMRGWLHALCIIAGILAPIGVTLLTTQDGGFRSLEHYRGVTGNADPHSAD